MLPLLLFMGLIADTSGVRVPPARNPAAPPARAAASPAAPNGVVADSVVVEKAAHRLTLYSSGAQIRSYTVALGRQPTGPKERIGDQRTPEGLYTIDSRNPNSQYHLSLHISYPSPQDRAHAAALGVSPGGEVMIHGLPNGQRIGPVHHFFDWTNGCIALRNEEIEEIWQTVPVGVPIEIKP